MTLNEWIIYGDVGRSSKTMWAAVADAVKSGRKGRELDVPYDADDFSRCYKFYKECELTKSCLEKIADVFPWWKPFTDNWEKLCKMYEKKLPMYDYIHSLELESKAIDGWKEVSPGCWQRGDK